MCYLWNWWLIVLQGGADLATGLAYIAISLIAVYIYRSGGLHAIASAFPALWRLGAAFVGLCGLSHILAAIEIFSPIYWLSGAERLGMAMVSAAFARILWLRKDDLSLMGRVLSESTRQLEAREGRVHGSRLPPERLPR